MAPATTYTVSLFMKLAERPYFRLLAYDRSGYIRSSSVNLQNGTIAGCNTTMPGSESIQSLSNGVYRVAMTFTTSSTDLGYGSYFDIRMVPSASSGCSGDNSAADGVSGVYFWGAQLEQGAFPTSYIPTSGSTVTRPSDTLCLSTSGWYNSGVGSVYGDFYGEGDSTGSARVFSIGSASPLTFNNSNSNLIHWPGPAGVSGVTASRPISASIFVPLRAIATWDDSGPLAKLSAQGLVAHSGSYIAGSYAGPTACIGQAVSKLYYLNSWVRRIGYFPNAQPDYSLPDYTR
jgi:hypothetical protein